MALETNKEEHLEMDEEIAVKQKLNPDTDMASPSKVKFTNDGKNGEAKVDVDKGYGGSVGMSKEELMKYANDPFWVKLRMFLFILFWVVWFAMLVGAIVIVAVAPKCSATSTLQWWQKTTMYQIYVRSFKDDNKDGEGDLKGLISKLSYLKDDIGVETLILSPIYSSEMKDSGYDVTDHTHIDPRYGTLDDFETLVKEMHDKDMKLIIDFIPNHTSDRHKWFTASVKSDPKYKDYYVWHNGNGINSSTGNPGVPNNWRSQSGGSAWTWNDERKQYYYHQFLPSQPDLNLWNEKVVSELKEVIKFWLKLKVDGIRIDSASHLAEDKELQNESIVSEKPSAGSDYNTLSHNYTVGIEKTFELLKDLRTTVHQFGQQKILLSESYEPTEKLVKYYGDSSDLIIDLPLNFVLKDVNFTIESNASKLKQILNSWISAVEGLKWPNMKPPRPWSAIVTGSHDMSRLATRIGPRLSEGIQMLAFIFPRNTPIVYYGDEIGLQDNHNTPQKTRNEGEASRLPSLSLMHWNKSGSSAGFSDEGISTWHSSNDPKGQNNVETQLTANFSTLQVFKQLVELRKSGAEAVFLGKTYFPNMKENVFVMIRTTDEFTEGENGYVLAINMNTSIKETIFLNETYLPEKGKIYLADSESHIPKGREISFSDISLEPHQSILVEFIPPK